MNTENEINEEVRQLLDSLEEHGKNARRQQDLSDLIDQLSEKELGTGTSSYVCSVKRRSDKDREKLYIYGHKQLTE